MADMQAGSSPEREVLFVFAVGWKAGLAVFGLLHAVSLGLAVHQITVPSGSAATGNTQTPRQATVAMPRKLNFRVMVISIAMLAVVARLVFLLDPCGYEGVLPQVLTAVLLHLPRMLLAWDCLAVTLMWTRVVAASSSMHRIRSVITIGKYKGVLVSAAVVLSLPLAVATAAACGSVDSLSSASLSRIVYGGAAILISTSAWRSVRRFHSFLHPTDGHRPVLSCRARARIASFRVWLTLASCMQSVCRLCRKDAPLRADPPPNRSVNAMRGVAGLAHALRSGARNNTVPDVYAVRAQKARLYVSMILVVMVIWSGVFILLMSQQVINVREWIAYFWFLQGLELCVTWTLLGTVWVSRKRSSMNFMNSRLARKLTALASSSTMVMSHNQNFIDQLPYGRSVRKSRLTRRGNHGEPTGLPIEQAAGGTMQPETKNEVFAPTPEALILAAAVATGAGWTGTGDDKDDAVIKAVLMENVTDIRSTIAAEHNLMHTSQPDQTQLAISVMSQQASQLTDNPMRTQAVDDRDDLVERSFADHNVIEDVKVGFLSPDLIKYLLAEPEAAGESAGSS